MHIQIMGMLPIDRYICKAQLYKMKIKVNEDLYDLPIKIVDGMAVDLNKSLNFFNR